MDLQTIPFDVLLEIVSNLEPGQVVNLCETNSYFQNTICRGEEFRQFWRELYKKQIDPQGPKDPLRAREEYTRIFTELSQLPKSTVPNIRIAEQLFYDVKDFPTLSKIDYAVGHHYRNLLDSLLEKYPDTLRFALFCSAHYGHLDMVMKIVDQLKRTDQHRVLKFLNYSIKYAVFRNHRHIVDYLISQGASIRVALNGAAKFGHCPLVQHLLERGFADGSLAIDNIDRAIFIAAVTNHPDIVEDLLARNGDINNALAGAANGGHLDLVRQLINRGATDFDHAIHLAALYSHRDVVNELLARGANINSALYGAAAGGNEDLVRDLISRGANDLNGGLANSSTIPVADIFLNLGATDLHGAIMMAEDSEHREVADYLRSLEDNRG